MDYRFGKTEKLKKDSQIKLLFSKGKSLRRYPIKLIYYPLSYEGGSKVGVSVPKRQFKKAVARNRLKRLMREGYRLNKQQIKSVTKAHALMFIYIGKKESNFKHVEMQITRLLQDLVDIVGKEPGT